MRSLGRRPAPEAYAQIELRFVRDEVRARRGEIFTCVLRPRPAAEIINLAEARTRLSQVRP
jgi:hypothetical protein